MLLAAGSAPAKQSGSFTPILIVAVIGIAVYFLLMRPQQRRRKAMMQTNSELAPGQRVRTTAGIYGTIVAIDGQDLDLEIAPGVEVRMMRRAIMDVVPEDGPDDGYSAADGPDGSHEDIPAEEAAAHEEAHSQAAPDEAADGAGDEDGDGKPAEGERRDRDPQDQTP
jgi:preprotein translocase subunit YajC